MLKTRGRADRRLSRRREARWRLLVPVAAGAAAALLPGAVRRADADSVWNGGNGNWSAAANWTGGVPNSATVSASIDNGAGVSVVTLDISANVNALTLDGDDTLRFGSAAALFVHGGATINGLIDLANGTNNTTANLYFTGTNSQLLGGTGVISLGTGNANCSLNNYANGTNTLTIGPGILVHGRAGAINGFSSSSGGILNQGTIAADVAGGTLTLTGVSNAGSIQGLNGDNITTSQAFSNLASGTVSMTGGTLTLNGAWHNAGVINLNSATVALGGTFTYSDIGTINVSGTAGQVILTGVMTNAGHVLNVSPTNQGSWTMTGGTIRGGTVAASGGSQLFITSSGNTLDGVTLATSPLFINFAQLFVDNGLTLNNVTLDLPNGSNGFSTNVYFTGTNSQLLSGVGIVSFGTAGSGCTLNNYANGTNTLTIGPGILVHGKTGTVNGLNSSSGGILNQGTIAADVAGGTLTLTGVSNAASIQGINGDNITTTQVFNNLASGTVSMTGGTLTLSGAWHNGGVINLNNATIVLGGAFTYGDIGTINRSGTAQVNLTGTLTNTAQVLTLSPTSQGSWTMIGGTIRGGTVAASGGSQLFITSSGNTLDGVTLATSPVFGTFAQLFVNNGLTLNSTTLDLANGTNNFSTNIYFTGTNAQTLAGTGIVSFGTNASGSTLNNYVSGTNTLTIGPNILVHGKTGSVNGVNSSTGGILNQGTIAADVAGGTFTLTGVSNAASIQGLNGDNITTTNLFNNLASGTVSVSGGGNLNFNSSFTNSGVINFNAGTTGASITLGGNNSVWHNFGTINGTNATINLGGAFIYSDIGTINRSGTTQVNLTGTLTNTAQVLTLSPTNLGSWTMTGGTIHGGTVTATGGAQLIISSNGNTLDGVTLATSPLINNNSQLFITNGLTLSNATLDLGNGSNGFSSNVYFTGTNAQALTGTGVITFGTNSSSSSLNNYVAGTNTLVFGGGIFIHGKNATINGINASTGGILNQGTIDADVSGGTITLTAVTNAGTFQASNGGMLSFVATASANVVGGVLSSGAWQVFGTSTLSITQLGPVVTNAASILLSGTGSTFLSGASHASLDSTLTSNQGLLQLLANRSFTSTSSAGIINSGTLQLGGGTFNPSSLTNTATGTIFGFGTITPTVQNAGTVRASGGTLVPHGGISGSGSIQVDSDGVLDLSTAIAPTSSGLLAHNGTGAASLSLGTNNVTVSGDYTNAAFGVGNSFNRRANVGGSGQILASGNAGQGLGGGDVSNGNAATATMSFGNVHVGDVRTLNYTVNNTGSSGPSIRGAIQTSVNGGNVTDARLGGAGVTAGNFGPVAPGASTTNLPVTFTASSAGTVTGQVVHILSNFDNIAGQNLQIVNSAAYRYASATAHQPEAIVFANRHVGDAASQTLTISNDDPADGFSESLDASFGGLTGAATAAGSFTLLAPGATNSSSLVVGMNTSSAGALTGTATLLLTSDGTGSSGLGTTALSAQTVHLSGNVYRLASAGAHLPEPVNFGNVHLGSAPTQTISLSNVDPNDGFSERLDASIGSFTGAATGSGSFTLLNPGATNNSSLVVGLVTTTAGAKTGSAILTLMSDGVGTSGLGTSALPSQTVNLTGAVYRLAAASPVAPASVDFGIVHVGDAVTRTLAITNTAAADGFSEGLNASFGTITGPITAIGSITRLAAGASNDTALSVGLNTSSAGSRSGTATLALLSDGLGTSNLGTSALSSQNVSVIGTVNNFAAPAFVLLGGAGSLVENTPTSYTLDLGAIRKNTGTLTANLGVGNTAAAPADTLAGSFIINAAAFGTSGFTAFSNVTAGGTQTGQAIFLSSTNIGSFSGTVTLMPQSQNARPFSTNLANVVLTVNATVPNIWTETYIGPSGSWTTGANWTPAGPPQAADYVMLTGTGGGAVNIAYDASATTVALGQVVIDATGGGTAAARTLSQSGGALTTAAEFVGFTGRGTLSISGGTHTVSGALTIAADAGSSGTVSLSGGTLIAGSLVNGGNFTQTGGSSTFGPVSGTSAGAFTLGGGAGTAVSSVASVAHAAVTIGAHGTLTVRAVTPRVTNSINSLSITSDGLLDLSNNALLVSNTATTETSVRQYLHNSYNADASGIGNWLGKGGITSSDAIASHNGTNPDFRISVGYVNGNYANDPLISGPIPGQETLPTNRTLIRPALYGDLNLDGKVDDTDLAIFSGLGQYNQPTDKFGWLGGDLNQDGKVDDTDLLIFSGAGNYNGPTYGAAAAAPAHASATPSLTGHTEANGDIVLSATTSAGVPGDGVLDFVYNPATGHLTLAYDGDPRVTAAQPFQVVRFKSAGGHFIPANFNPTDFGAGVTATTSALNGTASGSNSVPDGYDMGAVLPTGLTVSDLTSDLTLQWNVFGGGLTLKNGDVVVPEPATLALIGVGAIGLLPRRAPRKRRPVP